MAGFVVEVVGAVVKPAPVSQRVRRVVALATLLGSVLASAWASSIPDPYNLPVSYLHTGSNLPYQAKPGASTTFYLPLWNQADFPWWIRFEANLPSWSFQWFRDGTPVPGQDKWYLPLYNLQPVDSGTYAVRWSGPGFPERWAYFPLTVTAQAVAPVDTTLAVGSGNKGSNERKDRIERALPDGSIILRYWDFGSYSLTRPYWVRRRADGTTENLYTDDSDAYLYPAHVLRSGRILASDARLPALETLYGFITSFGNRFADWVVEDALEQPDGAIIVYATSRFSTPGKPDRTLRLRPDLSLDPTFVIREGFAPLEIDSAGRCLALQGTTLVRLNADGTDDPTFRPFANGSSVRHTLTREQPDGSIIVAAADPARVRFQHLSASGVPFPGDSGSIANPSTLIDRHYGSSLELDGRGRVYCIRPGGIVRYATVGDDAQDLTFNSGTGPNTLEAWSAFLLEDDDHLLAYAPGGDLARLRTTDVAPITAPGVRIAQWGLANPQARVELVAEPAGIGPFTYEWSSLDGGALPADTHSARLVFENIGVEHLRAYQVRITGPGGSSLSNVINLRPVPIPAFAALSGRGIVDTGESTLIAGYIADASSSVLHRAVGPTLATYGVQKAAADPQITVYRPGTAAAVGTNDNWTGELVSVFADFGAATWATGSKDAAINLSVEAATGVAGQARTVNVANPSGRGVALAEVYARDNDRVRLRALSLRGFAGRGDETLIGGFVVADDSGFGRPLRVLARIVGPTLGTYGITQPLADPVLGLYDPTGNRLASNDDWESSADVTAIRNATARVGLAPLPPGSRDSAVVLDLAPGAYTLHVGSKDGSTGIALIELYRVD